MIMNNAAEKLTDSDFLSSAALKQRVGQSFGKARQTYTQHAQLQRLSAQWLFEQLEAQLNNTNPQLGLDLGCGPGINLPKLSAFSQRLVACDLSVDMLLQAQQLIHSQQLYQVETRCADAESLPFATASMDWVFSNLMIQWCNPVSHAIAEIYRVLKPGGVAVVSTLLKGSLRELEESWKNVDDFQHVNQFVSAQELQQQVALANIEMPQILHKSVTLEYNTVIELSRDLKGIGANSVTSGKAAGLTGKGRWQRMTLNYERFRNSQQKLPATYELACILIKKTM